MKALGAQTYILKKIYVERDNLREQNSHQKKLKAIIAEDPSKRKQKIFKEHQDYTINKSNAQSLKKQKQFELNLENQILLDRLVQIAKTDKQDKVQERIRKIETLPVRSLNDLGKRTEAYRVALENESLARRLIHTQTSYSKEKQDKDYYFYSQMSKNLSQYKKANKSAQFQSTDYLSKLKQNKTLLEPINPKTLDTTAKLNEEIEALQRRLGYVNEESQQKDEDIQKAKIKNLIQKQTEENNFYLTQILVDDVQDDVFDKQQDVKQQLKLFQENQKNQNINEKSHDNGAADYQSGQKSYSGNSRNQDSAKNKENKIFKNEEDENKEQNNQIDSEKNDNKKEGNIQQQEDELKKKDKLE